MDNILADKTFLNDFNPKLLATLIANNFKLRRLELNITQEYLAKKSSVSLGSLKRFETSDEISLKNMLLLAVALNATHEFKLLFSKQQYKNIEELTRITKKKTRKRARSNVKGSS
jgi:transcriptional regulator with XRE-family HTH domain